MKVLLLLLILNLSAHAQDKTLGDVLSDIDKTAKKVNLNKKKSALPQAQRIERKKNLDAIRPPKSTNFNVAENSKEAELEKFVNEEIKQLYSLAQQYQRSQRRGEIWLRLAEAYIDKARLVEYKIQSDFEKKLERYQAKKTRRKPVLNLRPAQEFNRKAVQLYEWFIRDFPNDPKSDQALFFLGYNHFELNNPNKALSYYNSLLKKYPRSEYVDEANFSIGEYYFDNEEWAKAAQYYVKVAKKRQSKLLSFATYKLAWCQYKTGNIKPGLKSLERVIYLGQSESQKNKRGIQLADEALKDIVLFFAESRQYTEARRYFQKFVNPNKVDKVIERLAYYYADTGQRAPARYLFRDLISKDPYAPKAYDYQYQIVKLYFYAGDNRVILKELSDWISIYGPSGRWAKRNSKNSELVKKAGELVETTLRTFILQNHQTAQNSRGKESQKMAQRGYELYFDTFAKVEPYSKSSQIGNMHFFYGELLYDLKDYKRAAYHYLWLIDNDPKNQYARNAALNALLSLEKQLPSDKEIKKIVGDSKLPVSVDKATSMYGKVAKYYYETYPKADNADDVKFKVASLYYAYNQYDFAIPLYKDIISSQPNSKYAENASNLILHMYDLKGDYTALESAAEELLNIKSFARSKSAGKIRDIMVIAGFKRAQELESSKNFADAATNFKSFANKYPTSELSLAAAFNSGVNFERTNSMLNAIEMYQLVIDKKPRTKQDQKLRVDSYKFLAGLYEKTGQYEQAANVYETYAVNNPKDKISGDFFYNAAVIREGMNYYKLAFRNFNEYYKKTNQPDGLYHLAKVSEKRNNKKSAISYYEKYLNRGPKDAQKSIESAFKIAKINEQSGKKSEALKWYRTTLSVYKKYNKNDSSSSVGYAAEAEFKLAYETFIKLGAIKIPSNLAKQGPVVERKIALLDKLTNELKQVISYQDPYQVVASLTTIGQAYQHMAASLYAVETPKGLDNEQIKQFKDQIESIAKPYVDKAKENYKAAIEKAYELEAYDDNVLTARTQYNSLDNSKYQDYGQMAVLTKVPDWLDRVIETSKIPKELHKKVYEARKDKNEQALVSAVSEVLNVDQNDLYALNNLGLFYFLQEKYGLAKVIINRAIKAHPDEAALLNNLAIIFLQEGEKRKAFEAFAASKSINSTYPVSATNLGAIYLEYKDYSRALGPLKIGYEITKSDLKQGKDYAIEVANNYALALLGMDETRRAVNIFEEILDHNSRNAVVLLNYSILLVEYKKEKSEALDTLSKLKFITDRQDILDKVNSLEKKAYELDK